MASTSVLGKEMASPEDYVKVVGQKSALDQWPDILKHVVKGRRPLLFMDYDGTLAPIVSDPDK
jgi:hypothetical protein